MSFNLESYSYEVEKARLLSRRDALKIALDAELPVERRAAHLDKALTPDQTAFKITDSDYVKLLDQDSPDLQRFAIVSCGPTLAASSSARSELWRIWHRKCENSLVAILQLLKAEVAGALEAITDQFQLLTDDEQAQTVAAIGLTRNAAALPFLQKSVVGTPESIRFCFALAMARCGCNDGEDLLLCFLDISPEERLPIVCELAARNSKAGLLELREMLTTNLVPDVALRQCLLVAGILQNDRFNWREFALKWTLDKLEEIEPLNPR